ncbi:MAG: carboxymuconolactone decarboxylase family protein [Paracoccaceae bacterium]
MIERLDYIATNGAAIASMLAVKKDITTIDKRFQAVLETRVSQINGCAYCVDLHIRQARQAGETEQRLDCLVVWRETAFFTPAERAALAWAEALTHVADEGAPQELFDALSEHFSDAEIVDLTLIIAQINAWNRIAIGFAHRPDARG